MDPCGFFTLNIKWNYLFDFDGRACMTSMPILFLESGCDDLDY